MKRAGGPADTEIKLTVVRDGGTIFDGATTLSQMKRRPGELVEYLFHEQAFRSGVYLSQAVSI